MADSEQNGDEAAPEADPAPDRRRGRLLLWIAGAVAVVVFALVVEWSERWGPHPAEVAVEDFFQALRDGDAESARGLVDTGVSRYSPGFFLAAPEAINMPWEVPETELLEERENWARVAATVETADGTEMVEYSVRRSEDDWILDSSALLEVRFAWPPAAYGQVNDALVRLWNPAIEEMQNLGTTYKLFPGVYDFYQSVPGVVEIDSGGSEVLLVPGRDSAVARPSEIEFEAEAVAPIQREVDARMEDCLEERSPMPEGCPFWHNELIITADGEGLYPTSDAEWSIDEPLTISIGEYDPQGWPWFPLESDLPDMPVSLTAKGEDSGGSPQSFSTRCELDLTAWRATLAYDGEAVVLEHELGERLSGSEWSTCETEL